MEALTRFDRLVAEVMATLSPSQLSPVVIQITWAVTSSVSCCLGANSTAIAGSFQQIRGSSSP